MLSSKKQVNLNLEVLENRWVPATITYAGSTLLINNTTAQQASVSLSSTGNNVSVTLGTQTSKYNGVGNIVLTNGNANTTISTAGLTNYSGNLTITTGNGTDGVTIGGTQTGNTTLVLGNGADTLTLAAGYATNGSFQFSSTHSLDTFVTKGVYIGGNLSITNANVSLGADTIGGTVTISDSVANGNTSIAIGAATIGQNLSISTGNGTDSVTLTGTTVNGSTGITEGYGSANDQFSTVGTVSLGSLNFSTGSGDNSVTLSANTTVLGNAVFTFASGGTNVFTSNATYGGNFNLQAGDGSVTLGGSVGGNAFIQMGNLSGDSLTVTGPVGGLYNSLTFQLGNGNGDSVSITPTSAEYYAVNGTFGNGMADVFTLNSNVSISGSVLAGTNASSAIFNQNMATIVSPWTINF